MKSTTYTVAVFNFFTSNAKFSLSDTYQFSRTGVKKSKKYGEQSKVKQSMYRLEKALRATSG